MTMVNVYMMSVLKYGLLEECSFTVYAFM